MSKSKNETDKKAREKHNAWEQPSVRSAEERPQHSYEGSGPATQKTSEELRVEVIHALSLAPKIQPEMLEVEVDGSSVSLRGSVPEGVSIAELHKRVAEIAGVERVVAHIVTSRAAQQQSPPRES